MCLKSQLKTLVNSESFLKVSTALQKFNSGVLKNLESFNSGPVSGLLRDRCRKLSKSFFSHVKGLIVGMKKNEKR